MHRVFSPDDKSIRWDDLSHLPEVGSGFFDLAENLADGPVSHELDTAVFHKDGTGSVVEVPLPPAMQIDPAMVLMKIARLRHYRANRLPCSRDNVITVSRISGAAAEAIHQRQSIQEPEVAEKLRGIYQLIHRKVGVSYLDVLDPNYSEKNKRITDIYKSLGKIITGYSYYFYESKKR